MLVPGAIGIGLCNADAEFARSASAAAPREQGRVQGAAGALESLGRTLGPVWGNGALQRFGEGTAYGSAALVLIGAAALTIGDRAERAIRRTGRTSRRPTGPVERRSLTVEAAASSRSSRVTRSSSCSTTARTVSGCARSTPAFFSCSIG